MVILFHLPKTQNLFYSINSFDTLAQIINYMGELILVVDCFKTNNYGVTKLQTTAFMRFSCYRESFRLLLKSKPPTDFNYLTLTLEKKYIKSCNTKMQVQQV